MNYDSPDCTEGATKDYMGYVSLISMPDIGSPAPILIPGKAAIWLGESPDKRGELPALAVVTKPRRKIADSSTRWFVGLVSKEALNTAYETDSIAPLEAFVLNAATNIVQSRELTPHVSAKNALELLMLLHPREI